MIRAEDLHKAFYSRRLRGRIEAIAGISLTVSRGETYGLIGPDGAGKSTMMRLLCGLYLPDRGRAEVAGFDTVRHHRQIHRLSGYMAQRFALYGSLTVAENLAFFGRAHGLSRAECGERIPRLLRFAGLERFPDRLAARLSGGMKKKLALATMLIHEPQVVFLDEPTLGVDPISRREFWELLSALRSGRGLTIFVCTPYMDEAERCHTVGLIYEGRLIAQDAPRAIRASLPGEMLELRPRDLAARDAVAGLEGVLEVQTYGRLLRVFVDSAERRAGELVRAIQERGITVEGVRQVEPGMEEAFISLIRRQRAHQEQELV
jgi:ABC-2 type transport system ATP-binding protein